MSQNEIQVDICRWSPNIQLALNVKEEMILIQDRITLYHFFFNLWADAL